MSFGFNPDQHQSDGHSSCASLERQQDQNEPLTPSMPMVLETIPESISEVAAEGLDLSMFPSGPYSGKPPAHISTVKINKIKILERIP